MSSFKRVVVAVCTGGIVVGVGLVPATSAHAAYPGRNGLIAFEEEGDVWTIPPGGRTPTRITNDGRSLQPRWSADGRRIAVSRNGDIWTIKPDGSGGRLVTSGPAADVDPTWSPDGTRIAFARSLPGKPNAASIWAAPSAGGTATRLSAETSGSCAGQPTWSSTGRHIVYQRTKRSCTGAVSSIVMLDVTTRKSTVIATGPFRTLYGRMRLVGEPDFLPDGLHVIFQIGSGCITREVRTDLAGTNLRVFAELTGCNLDETADVAAAPDGRAYTGIWWGVDGGVNVIGTRYYAVIWAQNPDWQPVPSRAPDQEFRSW